MPQDETGNKMWNQIRRFFFASAYEVITWVWIGLSIGAFFYNAANKNVLGILLSVLSLISAVGAMLAIIFKRIFLDAPEEPKRPELFSNGGMMKPLIAGQPELVIVGLKNRGNAVARNIRLGGGNHLFTLKNFSGPLEYKAVDVTTYADLGPGDEENTLVSQSVQPLTAKRIKQLQEGEVLFFHFAEGESNDDSGNTYPIDYCYMFHPLSPTVMRTCPEKYWPRDRSKRRFPPRPHLVIQSAGVNLTAGERVDVHVAFTNDGAADAMNIRMSGVTTIAKNSFRGPLTRKGMTSNEVPMEVVSEER